MRIRPFRHSVYWVIALWPLVMAAFITIGKGQAFDTRDRFAFGCVLALVLLGWLFHRYDAYAPCCARCGK